MGPFAWDNQAFKTWIQNLKEFQINLSNITINYPSFTRGDYQCLQWTVIIRFFHTEQPQIRIQLDMLPEACAKNDEISFSWLNVFTIFFATISFLLELFYVLETLKILRKLKHVFDKKSNN